MTREQLFGHSQIGFKDAPCGYIPCVESDTESSTASLLRMIYNDSDGNRRGDIAAYLSEQVPADVREFIRQNILSSATPVSSQVEGLDDDVIAEYTRDASESVYDYVSRMKSKFEQASSDYELLKQRAKTAEKSAE